MESDYVSKLRTPTGLLFITQVIHEHGKPCRNFIDRENRITRWKTCPSATSSNTNPTWTDLGANSGLRNERSAINRIGHGTGWPHSWKLLFLLLLKGAFSVFNKCDSIRYLLRLLCLVSREGELVVFKVFVILNSSKRHWSLCGQGGSRCPHAIWWHGFIFETTHFWVYYDTDILLNTIAEARAILGKCYLKTFCRFQFCKKSINILLS
jgi:hypothetical protein